MLSQKSIACEFEHRWILNSIKKIFDKRCIRYPTHCSDRIKCILFSIPFLFSFSFYKPLIIASFKIIPYFIYGIVTRSYVDAKIISRLDYGLGFEQVPIPTDQSKHFIILSQLTINITPSLVIMI